MCNVPWGFCGCFNKEAQIKMVRDDWRNICELYPIYIGAALIAVSQHPAAVEVCRGLPKVAEEHIKIWGMMVEI